MAFMATDEAKSATHPPMKGRLRRGLMAGISGGATWAVLAAAFGGNLWWALIFGGVLAAVNLALPPRSANRSAKPS
jgi:hypothetical protein